MRELERHFAQPNESGGFETKSFDNRRSSMSDAVVGSSSAAAPPTFATRSERAVVLSILRDDFGEIAEKIALELLRSDGLRLVEVVPKVQAAALVVKPSVHEIKCTLLKLLQHNLLLIKPAGVVARGHAATAAVYNVRLSVCRRELEWTRSWLTHTHH